MKKFFSSIPIKICISILGIETFLLTVMGYHYTQKFCEEIDRNLKNKISMPAALLSKRALNLNTVVNIDSFENLLQEKIHDVFIAKPSGLIYYSALPEREGVHYERYLDEDERKLFQKINLHFSDQQIVFHQHKKINFISILSPLRNRTHLIGVLYIKIDGGVIAARKKEVMRVFFIGSLITIFLTSLLEVLLLHYLFVPRINKTRAVLSLVERGNLSVRIPQANSLDQLGSLMRHVNRMIAATERNTRLLKMVNEAGASFVTANTLDKLSELINKEVTDLQVYVSKTARLGTGYQEKKKHSLDPDPDQGFLLPSIGTSYKKGRSEGDEEKYLFPLLSMANSAFFRLRSWQKTRDAEKKYRTLFSSAVEGIFSYTIDGMLEVANPSLAKMMGYDTPESMTDQFNRERRLLFGNEEEQEKLFTRIHEQGQIQDVEIRPRRADGFRFWASLTAHVKKDQEGKPIAIDGRIANIEERKRREKIEYDYLTAQAANQAKSEMLGELETKNQELEKTLAELHDTQLRMIQAERMAAIGMTASGVAHDLNNILAGVVNYAELILYQLPDGTKMRISAQCILDSGKRAADVVADLLTLTRGTAQNRIPVLLNSIITEYLESAEFQYLSEQHPHIHVATSFAQDLFPVLGVPVYLHKMIMNLVINSFEAIEATENKGEVEVITENMIILPGEEHSSRDEGEYVVFKIIDNGAGIDQSDLKHIYEPFYTKKALGRSGTGLGLTMVQNAIIEHNGTIEVNSHEQGTVFIICLPAAMEGKLDTFDNKNDEESMLVEGSGSILVVDDNPTMREIAQCILEESGYTVYLAQSGEEAVQFCQGQVVDLILLDMLMPPGMNGRQTFEAIRRIHPQQKALLVSGYSEDVEVQKTLEAGCSGFLKKPYSMSQLSRLLKQVMS
ncbi:hypothetical protein KKHLCK_12990 [Candidatus Electrothrix laxa]